MCVRKMPSKQQGGVKIIKEVTNSEFSVYNQGKERGVAHSSVHVKYEDAAPCFNGWRALPKADVPHLLAELVCA